MGTDVPDCTPRYPDLVLQTGKHPNRKAISGSADGRTGVTLEPNNLSKNTADAD
jgi:hypothetical protein